MKLVKSYYTQPDVVSVARDLLGKVLFTRFNGLITSGVISETEAYEGITDRASHAFSGRHTSRTSIMYRQGGVAYIYLCYGIHSLFNVVTGASGTPHAVLVRSVIPLEGMALMLKRRKMTDSKSMLLDGPGKVSLAFGIHYLMTGTRLTGTSIWIEDHGIYPKSNTIKVTPRIGVEYAAKDALLPYRFLIDNPEKII